MDSLNSSAKVSMVKLAAIVCLLMLGSAILSRPSNADRSDQEIATVALCDLLSNPKLYEQKEVRVKAIYRVGYEWQELYCMDCWGTENRVWLDFGDDFESCTKKDVRRKLESTEGTYSVTLIGKLSGSQGGYGHMGAYRF